MMFIGNRLAKDSAFPQQVAACRTFNDFFLIYGEFWQQAARDYSAEFAAVTNLGWGAFQSVLEATKDQAPKTQRSSSS